MNITRDHLTASRRVSTWLAVSCLAVVAVDQLYAQAQEQPRDLQGIVPDYVPDGLTEDDFGQLDGNWAEWSDETGRLVTDFYTSEDSEVRARRETLQQIQGRLNTMQKALADPRYLPLYGPLADLNGRLVRRMAVAEALMETIEQDASQPSESRVNALTNRLLAKTRSLQDDLRGVNGGDRWIEYFALNDVAAAAGRRDASDEAISLFSRIHRKLENRDAYNDQQSEFLQRDSVQGFAGALEGVERLLNVENPEVRQQELSDLCATFMETIEEYEEEPTSETMQAIRDTFNEIRRTAPDGARALTAAMRKHYLNYNLRIVFDESLAQELVGQTQADSGFINEMVSNARVTGCQWTNAAVSLDLIPNSSGMRFDLVLDGNVRTSLTGSTRIATVQTSGQFHFHGRKPVVFDGEHFSASPASVGVGGGNRPYAAHTKFNWIPIVRRIAQNAALREAGSAENSQLARNKVYQQAKTEFDQESAEMLLQAEETIERDVAGPLREGGYYPDVKLLQSTDSEGILRSRLMEAGEVGGGDTLPLPVDRTQGVLVQLHESLLNQVGQRLDLDGKRFTPEDLKQYLKSELEQIAGRPVDLGGITEQDAASDSPKVEEIIFHEVDAIRFRLTGGAVVLYLNIGLKLEDRDEIEPQRITIPLQFALVDDQIHMERGTVGVSPIGRVAPRDRAQQITRAGVMRAKIQEAFAPQDFDASFELSLENKTLGLVLSDLRAHGGWLSLIAVDGVSTTRSSDEPAPTLQQVQVSGITPLR